MWHVSPDTEIDWKAYMQEVSGFLDGERDYLKLRGDTGPLVYPAGFVYLYSALHYFTSEGKNILVGQYFFAGVYLLTLMVVFGIYGSSKQVPPFMLIPLCLSKRVHSLYALRLFNDTLAMLFLYLCIWAMINHRWKLSCILYSLALSIKMNIVLFFPAFGLLLFKATGAWRCATHLALVLFVQLVVGYPFLTTYPTSYISRSFEFSRTFIFKWTVNWKFLDPKTFASPKFAAFLLLGHACVLSAFLFRRWCRAENGILAVLNQGFFKTSARARKAIAPDHIITLMFTSNFIGVVFARSLHYQFYSWYFHSLPYLLWHCKTIPTGFRFVLLAAIEYCWNVYPATWTSSSLLLSCHLMLLIGLWRDPSSAVTTPWPSTQQSTRRREESHRTT